MQNKYEIDDNVYKLTDERIDELVNEMKNNIKLKLEICTKDETRAVVLNGKFNKKLKDSGLDQSRVKFITKFVDTAPRNAGEK